jgi:hypothetical protein
MAKEDNQDWLSFAGAAIQSLQKYKGRELTEEERNIIEDFMELAETARKKNGN